MFAEKSLRERLRFFGRDSLIYGLGGAINKALALITFPLLARHFSVPEYGIIDYLNTWTVLIATFLMFGLDVAVARFYYDYDAKAEREQIVSQGLAFQMLVMAALVPIAWFLAEPIARTIGLREDNGVTLVRLVALQAPFFVLTTFSLNLLKWTFKGRRFLVVSVGATVFTIAALLAALATGWLDMVGVFSVYLASRALSGLVGLWLVRDLLVWPENLGKLRVLLPFAIPYAVTCTIGSLVPVFERWLVGGALGVVALGVYAAGSKVASLITLPTYALEMSWHPFSVSLHKEADAVRTFNVVLVGACLLLFGGTLVLSGVAELVVAVLGSARYAGAGSVTFALSMGLAVQSVGAISAVGVLLSKRAHLLLYSYGAMLLTAVLVAPLLASRFGIVGAAWGIMLGMLAKMLVETWLAQRFWPLQWRYGPAVMLGCYTLAVGLLQQVASESAIIHGINLISLAGLILMVPLAWWGGLSRADRNHILALARSQIRTEGR